MALQPLEANSPDPIVAKIQSGDHRGATKLSAERYGAAVGRFCTALLGNPGEGEEVAQEAFVAAYRGMNGFRGEGTVRGWIFGIARRLCARRLETRIRREQRLHLVTNATGGVSPQEEAERRQAAELVRRALALLKPSERDVLVMRYEGELGYREIGEACGIDEATARKRASRGLAHLRTILAKESV